MTAAKRPDEVSPRKPSDPPWRSRTAHRSCDPAAAAVLRSAREARSWSISEAARRSGVARRHIGMIEQSQRQPSVTVAEILITTYELTGQQADAVRSVALADVGRDSPYRSPQPSAAARTDP